MKKDAVGNLEVNMVNNFHSKLFTIRIVVLLFMSEIPERTGLQEEVASTALVLANDAPQLFEQPH